MAPPNEPKLKFQCRGFAFGYGEVWRFKVDPLKCTVTTGGKAVKLSDKLGRSQKSLNTSNEMVANNSV